MLVSSPLKRLRRVLSRSISRRSLVSLAAAFGLLVVAPLEAATFQVTKTDDTDDGVCDADCSLREAVAAANTTPGEDLIEVPEGVYVMGPAALETFESVSIDGAAEHLTIVRGSPGGTGSNDGVTFFNQSGTLSLSGLTLEKGRTAIVTEDGPGVGLVLRRVTVREYGTVGFDGRNVISLGRDTSLEAYKSTFVDNEATSPGAAMRLRAGSTGFLSGCLFARNRATQGSGPGALETQGAVEVTVLNSTFSDNGTPEANNTKNAVFHGQLDIRNNTFVGGPIRFFETATGVFANNLLLDVCDGAMPFPSSGGNIESPGNTCGLANPTDQTAVPASAARITELELYGGPTATYKPRLDSVAVESAVDALCPAQDARGVDRPTDSDGDSVARCEVGAVELRTPLTFADAFETGDTTAWE